VEFLWWRCHYCDVTCT